MTKVYQHVHRRKGGLGYELYRIAEFAVYVLMWVTVMPMVYVLAVGYWILSGDCRTVKLNGMPRGKR